MCIRDSKQVAFVPLSASQALVVLVAGDGAVENRVIDVPVGLNPSALVEAGNYISACLLYTSRCV